MRAGRLDRPTSSRPALARPEPWPAGRSPGGSRPRRRSAGPAATLSGPAEAAPPPAGLEPVEAVPTNWTRTWLGPAYWGNRLQDWRLHEGRLECLADTGPMRTRTVAVLTRELVAGDRPAGWGSDRMLGGGDGFSGFLVGTGGGRLDHRAAALVRAPPAEGGTCLHLRE